jgi:5-methylcytosine-specific restriction endonuclease McrA
LSRPILARRDTKSQEDQQRRKVLARDGHVCRFEYLSKGVWAECGSKEATDTSHIYHRRNCGKARFHEDVALRACRPCHTAYDSYQGAVRVPADREARAYQTICENSKVKPVRQNLEGRAA